MLENTVSKGENHMNLKDYYFMHFICIVQYFRYLKYKKRRQLHLLELL